MPYERGSTIVAWLTSPPTHVGWITVGATGAPRWQETFSNVTAYVAVVSETGVQPGGSCSGQATPDGSKFAVTVTLCPAAYGPGGSAAYVIPSVPVSPRIGTVTSPRVHTASVTAGATGVARSHEAATSNSGTVAVVSSTACPGQVDGPPSEPVVDGRRHGHRDVGRPVTEVGRVDGVHDAGLVWEPDRRRRHHTVGARRLCFTAGATGTTGLHDTRSNTTV